MKEAIKANVPAGNALYWGEKLASDKTASLNYIRTILKAWQAFICHNDPKRYFLEPEQRELFSYFMPMRTTVRQMAAIYANINGISEDEALTDEHFNPMVQYINNNHPLEDYHAFCVSVKNLHFLEMIQTVKFYFLRYRNLVALPHSDLQQFNKFRNWRTRIDVACEVLNEKIQTECLTTQELRLAYVAAVAGKKILDPMASPVGPLLTEGHIEPLIDFLRNNYAVTVFLYDNIDKIASLGADYENFCRENAAYTVYKTNILFKNLDLLHLLQKLTDNEWKPHLTAGYYIEVCATPHNRRYHFATQCMGIIEDFHTNHGTDAWSKLQQIFHGANTAELLPQIALMTLLQKNPNIAFFFYERRKKLITLAYHCRAQYGMHGKFGSNKSLMLFNKGIRKCHHEASSANNKQLNLSGA